MFAWGVQTDIYGASRRNKSEGRSGQMRTKENGRRGNESTWWGERRERSAATAHSFRCTSLLDFLRSISVPLGGQLADTRIHVYACNTRNARLRGQRVTRGAAAWPPIVVADGAQRSTTKLTRNATLHFLALMNLFSLYQSMLRCKIGDDPDSDPDLRSFKSCVGTKIRRWTDDVRQRLLDECRFMIIFIKINYNL